MLNRITLQGRLTDTPELRQTQNGTPVCSFTIACDDGFGDKKKTYFFDCVAWKNTADNICKFFQKGQMILVDGKLANRKYEDKNGNKRTATETVVNSFEFCESKNSAGQAGTSPQGAQIPQINYSEVGDFSEMPEDSDDLPF